MRNNRIQAVLEKHFTGASMDYRQMVSLFIPILVDQAFLTGFNLLNTAMVSSSGVAAVSAVSMIDSLNIFLINVFVAVATGGTVVVAQYKGSGNGKMVSRAAASAVSSVTLLAVLIGALVVSFYHPLLRALFGSASPDVMAEAQTYLIGSGVSYAGIAIVQAVCGVLRGVGRSRASLALSMIMNLSYLLLNAVLILLLHQGVLGLSISANVSRYAAAVCALVYLVKTSAELKVRMRDLLHFNLAMLRKILFIGLPFAAEQMFFNGGKMLTQVFIVSLGTYALAANAVCNTLASVYQIPSGALSLTAVTVVGQCVGSRNIADARKFTRSFVWLSSLALTLTALILLPLSKPLVDLFQPPAEIYDDIYWILLINAIAQIPLWSISFILPSALRAAGDSKYTSIVSMLSMWLFRVVLGYILAIVLHVGLLGVWIAMNCEWGVRGLIFLRRYRGEKWYRHRLVD
ncbi:MATE family efflux transporter [Cohnella caldifontis]|uniref:MATE family efflux transporter n=1 Tax=Cohnella caldifontis TaxID=3027471 RepID=UPI0023EB8021|nr:MATE family efflux transporter [Cohnella sp. YIM B05605]